MNNYTYIINRICNQYIKEYVDVQDGEEDDDDWAEETTEEAQRRRMEEISDHAKNLTLSEDLEKTLEERVNLFYNFVKVNNVTVICFLCKNIF